MPAFDLGRSGTGWKDESPQPLGPGTPEEIARECKRTTHKGVVVTLELGVSTFETAEAIAKLNLGKVVVLTGARIPEQVSGSDAHVNISYAIGVTQFIQTPGVYIALSNIVFAWNKCRLSHFGHLISTEPMESDDDTPF